jgi:hypothetical protein
LGVFQNNYFNIKNCDYYSIQFLLWSLLWI